MKSEFLFWGKQNLFMLLQPQEGMAFPSAGVLDTTEKLGISCDLISEAKPFLRVRETLNSPGCCEKSRQNGTEDGWRRPALHRSAEIGPS